MRTYVYVRACAYVHMFAQICVSACVCVRTCASIRVRTYVCVRTCAYVGPCANVRVRTSVCVRPCAFVRLRTSVHLACAELALTLSVHVYVTFLSGAPVTNKQVT